MKEKEVWIDYSLFGYEVSFNFINGHVLSNTQAALLSGHIDLGPVVRKVNSAIHRIVIFSPVVKNAWKVIKLQISNS
jgi:hypothetical protein